MNPLRDSQILYDCLSSRPSRISDVLTLLNWTEARLLAALAARPGAFDLCALGGTYESIEWNGQTYSHISRVEQQPDRSDPAIDAWWSACTPEVRQETLW
jgi:hypothetical protein